MAESYGERLEQIRRDMSLSKVEFAEFLGIPYRTYQDIASGKVAKPQEDTRAKVDAALGARTRGKTQEEWDSELTAFLRLLGAYLWALPATERSSIIDQMIIDLALRDRP